MDAENISDRDSLEAWLQGRPREDSIWLAHRAAMRVLPIWASSAVVSPAPLSDLRYVKLLRALFTSGVGYKYAISEGMVEAAAALTFADAGPTLLANALATGEARAAPAIAARAAAIKAALADAPFAAALAAAAIAVAGAAAWRQVTNDCAAVQRGDAFDAVPLWLGAPNLCQSRWDETRADWQADPDYDFWLRWYEAVLAGKAPNWALLHHIALIPNEDWEKGIGHIGKVIADIELQHAIAATPNAEQIVVNPATGLLMLETMSDLPADHLVDVLDMLRDAQSIFDGKGEGNHPYETIADERALMDRAIADYAFRPRMIYNTCMRVVQRIESKTSSGDCPANDANINDYQGQLGSAANKLLTHDSMVKEAVTAEAATRLQNVTKAQGNVIVAASTELALITEGALKDELRANALIAVDSTAADKHRKEALYVTISRYVRISVVTGYSSAKWALSEVADISEKIAKIVKNWTKVKAALAILKLLLG